MEKSKQTYGDGLLEQEVELVDEDLLGGLEDLSLGSICVNDSAKEFYQCDS